MLAFSMSGMDIEYDLELTLWSLFVPIMVTAIGFFAVSARGLGRETLGIGGLLMGLGIGAMHYMGMAAMTMHAELSYDPLWVAFSFIIAISAATVALWLSVRGRRLLLQGVAAVAMGFAVAGMHYSAMAGARFSPLDHGMPTSSGSELDLLTLALSVAGSTFIVLFLGLTASLHDRRLAAISEREAEALRYSEERFRELYSKTPLPLHSLDEQGRLESVSDAWLKLIGYRRNDVIGRPLSSFMTETSARQLLSHDWPLLFGTGECLNVEYRLVARGGVLVDVLVSTRVEQTTRGALIIGGLVDITERRRAEAALRQAQKMEAIGKLTGGVAHDFNNLLAVIGGNLELLRKRLPPDSLRASALIENALQATQRGAGLVQRMLTFARKQELNPSSVALPDVVLNMQELLQRSVGPQISISTRFPLCLPLANVDVNQLEMVLINLVVNARDAMPEGGSICIEGQLRGGSSSVQPANNYIALIVRDNGIGMSPETLTRATEPFYTTKAPGKGTGLGLSMAHGLAEQSGGQLVIQSTLGEGTNVELWLPLGITSTSELRTPKRKDEAIVPPTASALSILVVDDDPLVRENTAALLEDLGHQVRAADSGEAALALLREPERYDILITDQIMPVMTGTQLARIVRLEKPDLPILLVSGYSNLTEEGLALRTLAKPFTQEALNAAINDTVQRPKTGTVIRLHDRQ